MPLDHLPPGSRPREKLLARGAAALDDTELLAILLRTGLPGKSVLHMAQELLSMQHGQRTGIAGLLQAEPQALAQVKGLGAAKRSELLAVMELARRALAQQLREQQVFSHPQALKDYVALHLAALPHEVFSVLFLDHQHRLLKMEQMFRGTLAESSVYPREVAVRALYWQASAVVLAHNHPSGHLQPSPADLSLTGVLQKALGLLDIRVLDHVIVGPGGALSMVERGML